MENLENKCICWDSILLQNEDSHLYQSQNLVISKENSQSEDKDIFSHNNNQNKNASQYKFNNDLNKKIFIGNFDLLSTNFSESPHSPDALILQTNKNIFKLRTPYRQRILQECGTKILENFKFHSANLELSECVITDSYSLANFRKIIHVVLPKFNENFQNACESSLHLAIRNIFDICLEKNINSICFGIDIFQPSQNFPIEMSTHVLFRTIRKCLEKFGKKFEAIFFIIEKNEFIIFNKIKEHMKIYFPRSEIEEQFFFNKFFKEKSSQFHTLKVTEYGDIILPERQLNLTFDLDKKCNENKSNLEEFYIREEDDIKNYKIFTDDEKRIQKSLAQSKDFSKKFFLELTNNENKKNQAEDMHTYFDSIKFFDYKGSDIMKRQIFFFHLKLINFYEIDNEHMTDNLILYIAECKDDFLNKNLDIKNIISHLAQNSKRLSFIVFCKDAQRKNYPSVYFIKIVSQIVASLIENEKINIGDVDIILFQPGIVLKLFFYFLRIYVDASIWNRIEFIESYQMLNEKFYFEIDEETEYEKLRIKFIDEKMLVNLTNVGSNKYKQDVDEDIANADRNDNKNYYQKSPSQNEVKDINRNEDEDVVNENFLNIIN